MPAARLIQGDAIEALRTVPTGSVKAAVFDPPYPTISGGSNEGRKNEWNRPKGILTKNDGRIFRHNDISPDVYLPEVHRVLADQAHLYLMTNFLGLREGLLSKVQDAGFALHNLLFWRKNNATPNRWYMKNVEYVVFARKGKAFSIAGKGSLTAHETFDHPLDWPSVPSPRSHPTEKPVDLMETYIRNSTEEGDVVLDPFMGTGSTGVAALNLGRRFIGIELDPEYATKAADRLDAGLEVLGDQEIEEMLA